MVNADPAEVQAESLLAARKDLIRQNCPNKREESTDASSRRWLTRRLKIGLPKADTLKAK